VRAGGSGAATTSTNTRPVNELAGPWVVSSELQVSFIVLLADRREGYSGGEAFGPARVDAPEEIGAPGGHGRTITLIASRSAIAR
jgi:hypothetical protein